MGEHDPRNLELVDDAKADWMARAFKLYLPMESLGRTKTFGGIPGEIEPYGFASFDANGALYTVLNPAQALNRVELPRLSQEQATAGPGDSFSRRGISAGVRRPIHHTGAGADGGDRFRQVRASPVRHGHRG
jgi:hypothetical protein